MFPAMTWGCGSSRMKSVASRAIGAIAGATIVACGTVLEPFAYVPDAGASDGTIADARQHTDVASDQRPPGRDVGTNDVRGDTGGSAGASGAAGSGNGGNGGNAGAGGAAGTGGVGGSAGAAGSAGSGGGAGTGGAAGAGGSAGRDGGGTGSSIAVQGHIGAIGTANSTIGNLRVVHQRITTSSRRLCNGSICVTGDLAP
jgi:hypothetical protein